jgi:hypothetical protein
MWYVPTPDAQLQFLQNVQRVLTEGAFTTSYKFALVRALSDLAVLAGDDSGAPLELKTREIAARMVDLYWRQARPFPVTGEPSDPAVGDPNAVRHLLLMQIGNRNTAIVRHIAEAQREFGGSLFRFQRQACDRYRQLVAEVDQVVRIHPLWKLQTVGEQRVEFLYENVGRGNRITLRPGVAYCFRAFYDLVRNLVEASWARFVQKVNFGRLGNVADLSTFLFGRERTSLERYREILFEVQQGRCLYCRRAIAGAAHVDHFVPWQRFPADWGQNLILAHDACNSAKTDYLAAEPHLETWCERNRTYGAEMEERFAAAGLPSDAAATEQVARWAYAQTERAGGTVWLTGKTLKRIDPRWCLALAESFDFGYQTAD